MIASSQHLGRVLLATRTALFTPENSLEFGFQKSSLCHFCATFGFLKGFSGLADLSLPAPRNATPRGKERVNWASVGD